MEIVKGPGEKERESSCTDDRALKSSNQFEFNWFNRQRRGPCTDAGVCFMMGEVTMDNGVHAGTGSSPE